MENIIKIFVYIFLNLHLVSELFLTYDIFIKID